MEGVDSFKPVFQLTRSASELLFIYKQSESTSLQEQSRYKKRGPGDLNFDLKAAYRVDILASSGSADGRMVKSTKKLTE
jgi:hypothetical protein